MKIIFGVIISLSAIAFLSDYVQADSQQDLSEEHGNNEKDTIVKATSEEEVEKPDSGSENVEEPPEDIPKDEPSESSRGRDEISNSEPLASELILLGQTLVEQGMLNTFNPTASPSTQGSDTSDHSRVSGTDGSLSNPPPTRRHGSEAKHPSNQYPPNRQNSTPRPKNTSGRGNKGKSGKGKSGKGKGGKGKW